jgi:hypothetical protein
MGRVQVGPAVGGGERQRESLHPASGAQASACPGRDAAGGLHRGLAAHGRRSHGWVLLDCSNHAIYFVAAHSSDSLMSCKTLNKTQDNN